MSAGQLEFVSKLIEVLYPPFQQSFVEIFHTFFPSIHVQGGYSVTGCKLLDDVAHSGHRTIKISGDGLLALRLSMLEVVHYLTSAGVPIFLTMTMTMT